jgi:hypothetical protein
MRSSIWLDVGLVHPFEADRLHRPYDALETRTGILGQGIKLRLHLGEDVMQGGGREAIGESLRPPPVVMRTKALSAR